MKLVRPGLGDVTVTDDDEIRLMASASTLLEALLKQYEYLLKQPNTCVPKSVRYAIEMALPSEVVNEVLAKADG